MNKLTRTKQCRNCPWKVSTNPFDIPNGYDPEKHRNLSCTIANDMNAFVSSLHVMACHHSDKDLCIGWLVNQLGPGNNIKLRLIMRTYENLKDIKTYGEQHSTFEETLPENKL